MSKSVSINPPVKAGWLRVLIYFLVFLIVSGSGLVVYMLGVRKGSLDLRGFQELEKTGNLLPVTLILFITGLLLTYVFRRWVDRKPFISLGLDFNGHFREAIAGAALSVFIVCTSCLILKLTGHLKWMDIIFDPKSLFLAFGTILLAAFYEELVFRGYILNNLMDSFHKWPALFISAVLFMIFHWNSVGLFPLLNDLIMGLILGLNYIYTRNLWFSIFFHASWKFMIMPILGFAGEGSSQTLLQITLQGDENITGGTNGLEGSFILTAVCLLCGLAMYLMLQKKINPGSQPVPGQI
jgi:hypothetical protein